MGRATEYIDNPALTIGVTVQPEVLGGLMEKPGFRGRGLLGRFCYALPPNPLGLRAINVPPVPVSVRATYQANVRTLLTRPTGEAETGELVAHELKLTPSASRRLLALQKWIEPQLGEFGELANMSDWAGKFAGTVARIAGILHLADRVQNAFPWNAAISLEALERAIEIGMCLLAHARAAYGEMGSAPKVEDARVIVRWLERTGVDNVSKREIFNGVRGQFNKVADMAQALTLLVEHGYLREEPVQYRSGAGRKPSPRYEVNPLLGTQNTHITQNLDTALADLTRSSQANTDTDLDDDPLGGDPADGKEVA